MSQICFGIICASAMAFTPSTGLFCILFVLVYHTDRPSVTARSSEKELVTSRPEVTFKISNQ